jgi:DNA polymerase III epsilon subunit-like protein
MILFFDTETTGLPRNWKAPVTDVNNWPRMVQLAYQFYDANGNKISGADYIIKPDGFTISAEVSKVHGITNERAIREGVPVRIVLQEFNNLINQTSLLVAHNMSFDSKIVGAEFIRAGMTNTIPLNDSFAQWKNLLTIVPFLDLMVINGQNYQSCITNYSGSILMRHTMQPLIFRPL